MGNARAVFFNPDGRETFCGNGLRCAARLAYLNGVAPARMAIETSVMVHRAEVKGTQVSVELRDPRGFDDRVEVQAGGETLRGVFMDTGVPHFVVFRSMPVAESIDPLARVLRRHPRFEPSGTNVDFVEQTPDGVLAIRTYERGVEGETLACGTGCVAAGVAAVALGRGTSPVTLRTRSGSLIRVRFEGPPARAGGVRLEGEARLIYVGQITAEAMQGFHPRS